MEEGERREKEAFEIGEMFSYSKAKNIKERSKEEFKRGF